MFVPITFVIYFINKPFIIILLLLFIFNLQITDKLKLRLKIRTFLNSAYPCLFKNVLNFITRWSRARDNAENILGGFSFKNAKKVRFLVLKCHKVWENLYALLRVHIKIKARKNIQQWLSSSIAFNNFAHCKLPSIIPAVNVLFVYASLTYSSFLFDIHTGYRNI